MPDWEITATTIYCENVDDEVTLMVTTSDGTVQCTGRMRYEQPDKATKSLIDDKYKRLNRKLGCTAQNCEELNKYRERMLAD